MIEITVKEFLESILPVAVLMEFPEKPDARFVVLRKSSGPRENYIDSAQIVADSYAESLYEAATLNEMVKTALDALVQLPEICSSERVADYPAFDTQNRRYRYQAVQSLTHY